MTDGSFPQEFPSLIYNLEIAISQIAASGSILIWTKRLRKNKNKSF